MKINRINKYKFALVILSLISACIVGRAETPADLLKKSISSVGANSGCVIQAAASGIYKGKVSITMQGKRYMIDAGNYKVWYNGDNMWSYNKEAGETTLSRPSASEAAQANPLSIAMSRYSDFNVSLAPKQVAGKKQLVLIPKKSSDPVKRALITIDAKTYSPKKAVVRFSNGSVATIEIKSIKPAGNLKKNFFDYPKTKYSGVELLDLR